MSGSWVYSPEVKPSLRPLLSKRIHKYSGIGGVKKKIKIIDCYKALASLDYVYQASDYFKFLSTFKGYVKGEIFERQFSISGLLL